MFPALKKKTINFPALIASNVQSEQNQTTYSYAQALEIPTLKSVTKQNNTSIQNAV